MKSHQKYITGIAAFGDAPSVLLPALTLIAVIGMLSAYGFALIGRCCAYTGATSYREAWAKTVGAGTSWIPAVSATLKTFFACLAFSMVLADTFTGLLQRTASDRTAVLVTLTSVVLLPLCWMKNLSSLAPFSLLGVLGMLYTAIAMTIRYLDGSYGVNGALRQHLASHLQPAFGDAGWKSVLNPQSLILVCMLSTAYMVRTDRRTAL
jgi:amino acid permease